MTFQPNIWQRIIAMIAAISCLGNGLNQNDPGWSAAFSYVFAAILAMTATMRGSGFVTEKLKAAFVSKRFWSLLAVVAVAVVIGLTFYGMEAQKAQAALSKEAAALDARIAADSAKDAAALAAKAAADAKADTAVRKAVDAAASHREKLEQVAERLRAARMRDAEPADFASDYPSSTYPE